MPQRINYNCPRYPVQAPFVLEYKKFIELKSKGRAGGKSYILNIGAASSDELFVTREDYLIVEVEAGGTYRLVPDSDLEKLCRTAGVASRLGLLPEAELTLSFLLRLCRLIHGLSQTELANRAGIQPCQISLIENRPSYRPQPETINKLGSVLGEGFCDVVRNVIA